MVGFLASDNELTTPIFLSTMYHFSLESGSAYPERYSYFENDNALNRYFALIGGNDPLSYYIGKNDKASYLEVVLRNKNLTHGDNGFFIRKELIEATNLNNYFHIDNAYEADVIPRPISLDIWHKTGGNIFSFFKKRYRYGLEHAFNKNRRWHLVDFSKPQDIWRLIWFISCTLMIIEPLILSFRGYLKIKDKAWFLHLPVCFLTLVTYFVLVLHIGLRNLTQSLSAPMKDQIA